MPDRIPQTLVKTSHALTIVVGGVTVGLINGWNPTQSRTITPVYQIGTLPPQPAVFTGNPVEKIPGNVTGLTVEVSRYDIYTKRMEQAFGTDDLQMLSRQDAPFLVRESWITPDNSPGAQAEQVTYTGCWFSKIGRTFRSDGDRIVNVSATLEYTAKLISRA